MTYFVLLPILVAIGVGVSFLTQRAFAHFVDASALARIAILLTLVWALLGWKMEAIRGERAASVAATCLGDVEADLIKLEGILWEALAE